MIDVDLGMIADVTLAVVYIFLIILYVCLMLIGKKSGLLEEE